ncbi:MAG: hypothetical protein ACE5FS_03410 [Paracoccaceae bacterium]
MPKQAEKLQRNLRIRPEDAERLQAIVIKVVDTSATPDGLLDGLLSGGVHSRRHAAYARGLFDVCVAVKQWFESEGTRRGTPEAAS